MIKKTIKYVDFENNERVEDHYFHMSLPEFARLEGRNNGVAIDEYVKDLAKDKDLGKLIAFIEDIILSSYGKKSSDGRRFMKTKEIREEFEYSQAYAELFEELMSSSETAEKFAEGVGTQTKQRLTSVEAVPEKE